MGQGGVFVQDGRSRLACQLDNLAVSGKVGKFQVEGYAALLRALQVAWTAETEVGFGNLETVVRLSHYVYAPASVGGKFVFRYQYAITLACATSHTSAQLMQLGQAEALGILYHHHRGVGYVHTHFYHRGGHQDLRLSADKALHFRILVGRFHLAVHHAYLVLGEYLLQVYVCRLHVLQVKFLALLHQRVHHVHLPSLLNLLVYAAIEFVGIVVVHVHGLYGLSAWRKFVYHGDVQVAVQGHGQCARYGRGGHHKHMRRCEVLFPQLGTLCHTEAVLLVYDHESEVAEKHIVLYHGMSAYEYLHLSRLQALHHGLAPLSLYHACEQFHAHRHVAQHLAEGCEVLFGKDFGRCHDARLITVVQGNEHGHQCHHGLARAHIALHQTVHLPSRLHVGMHLAYHALLRFGQLEWQVVGIEGVEVVSHSGEDVSAYGPLAQTRIAEHRQLHVEEFFKLQPVVGLGEPVGRRGIVCGPQCLVPRHHAKALQHVAWQCLGNASFGKVPYQCAREPLESARHHARLLHALRGLVVRLHAHLAQHQGVGRVYVGMRDVYPVVE